MKILLADDDRQYCLALKKYLEKQNKGYEASLAFDGLEAKRYIEGNSYDVIFIDCDMPYLSGLDLVRVIKKGYPSTKVVMVSGYKDIGENFAKISGVDEFLRKPFALKEMDRILDKYDCTK